MAHNTLGGASEPRCWSGNDVALNLPGSCNVEHQPSCDRPEPGHDRPEPGRDRPGCTPVLPGAAQTPH